MTAGYVRGAHPEDRHFGAACGCVFIIRRYATLKRHAADEVQADNFWFCMACQNNGGPALHRRIDPSTASTYFFNVEQDDEGLRWQ